MRQILIVEDDMALSNGIALALKGEDLVFIKAYTLQEARKVVMGQEIDLIILDINLPDGNGLEFLEWFKAKHEKPVILLTANDLETDIVTGFEMGADDYVTKPFSLMILRARVGAQLRKGQVVVKNDYAIDDFSFDFEKMNFSKKGVAIELSKTEQKLLRLLVENKGNTLTRGQLVDQIWSDGAEYVDENALSVTVKRLRNKIEETPSNPHYIKTVYGLGYVWVTE